jgi:hypothetical protein
MPIDRNRLDRMITMMDEYLAAQKADNDRDTDPEQFLEAPHRTLPVSEPPAEPTEDSVPARIHGSPKHDLFR